VHLGIEESFTPATKAHPAFLVHDLETLREKIDAAGYRITDDMPLEGFSRCHVRDPFGNRLELVEPV
jgi:catechol 2,3-dioxygenase-like lactoylglutathione lyase family enzyme